MLTASAQGSRTVLGLLAGMALAGCAARGAKVESTPGEISGNGAASAQGTGAPDGGSYPSPMAGQRPKLGERAPDFTLPGPGGTSVHLADLLGKGPVVVYFYPKDETAGCTAEACAFRDAYEDFGSAGAQVVGISRDDPESHRRFAAHHRLPFLLLSDPTGEVHDRYGVASRLGGILRDRVTFVVDREGVVRHVFSSGLRMRAHVDESLAIVRQLAR
jgi:peroxiredoxin Q/BCP